jgi:hypothetical protein
MKLSSCLAALFLLSGCVGNLGPESEPGDGPFAASGGWGSEPSEGGGGAGDVGGDGGDGGEVLLPYPHEPCAEGDCWDAPGVTAMCGEVSIVEDFSSGKYNVHERPVSVPAGVPVELTLAREAGLWNPALLVFDEGGDIVHDGEISLSDDDLQVELITTGRESSQAAVRVTAASATQLSVVATAWGVVESSFTESMPTDAVYDLGLAAACDPVLPGDLLSPPNFDPNDIDGGFFLLPYSDPPGLYERKADGCSRGNKLLIDVIYTVAFHWKGMRPELAPIAVRDLNEGPCSTVDHATHEDGTHVDIVAGCATAVACQDNNPAIELAKLFVDTGMACGIINNDPAVQAVVNAYFNQTQSYDPWKGQFMRSVSGHTHHFHVRVKKPNGQCN